MFHKGFHISEFTEIKDIENVVDYCLFNFDDFEWLTDLGCIINKSKDVDFDGKIKNHIQVIRVRCSGQGFGSCGYYFNIPKNKVHILIKQTRKRLLLSSFENKKGE
jgi:hypothetical protein